MLRRARWQVSQQKRLRTQALKPDSGSAISQLCNSARLTPVSCASYFSHLRNENKHSISFLGLLVRLYKPIFVKGSVCPEHGSAN